MVHMIFLKRNTILKNKITKNTVLVILPFLVVSLSLIVSEWFNKESRIENAVYISILSNKEETQLLAINPVFRSFLEKSYYNLRPEMELDRKKINMLFSQKDEVAEIHGRRDLFIGFLSIDRSILISSKDPGEFSSIIEEVILPVTRNSISSEIVKNIHTTVAPVVSDNEINGYIIMLHEIPRSEISRQELRFMLRNLLIILSSLVLFFLIVQVYWRMERKKNSLILREKDEYYKAIVESYAGFILITNKKCIIEFMNGNFRDYVGRDCTGSFCYEIIFSFDSPCLWCQNEDVLEGRRCSQEIRDSKSDRWYYVVNSPIFHIDGSISTLSLLQDITQRKKAEESLQKANNYIVNIINSMPSILICVDRDGMITQWNRAAYDSTGISHDEALGNPVGEKMPRLKNDMERIRFTIDNHRKIVDSNRRCVRDDAVCFEDITVFPLISNSTEGAVIIIDDVTERNRIEEMIIQNEKMLSVGGMAAGMAHEINNPLAGIIQTANVIANRLGERIEIPANIKAAEQAGTSVQAIRDFMKSRKIPEMLKAINESGQRVSEIIGNMLSFSRKSKNIFSSYRLDELMDKSLELAGADYDLKKEHDFKKITIFLLKHKLRHDIMVN